MVEEDEDVVVEMASTKCEMIPSTLDRQLTVVNPTVMASSPAVGEDTVVLEVGEEEEGVIAIVEDLTEAMAAATILMVEAAEADMGHMLLEVTPIREVEAVMVDDRQFPRVHTTLARDLLQMYQWPLLMDLAVVVTATTLEDDHKDLREEEVMVTTMVDNNLKVLMGRVGADTTPRLQILDPMDVVIMADMEGTEGMEDNSKGMVNHSKDLTASHREVDLLAAADSLLEDSRQCVVDVDGNLFIFKAHCYPCTLNARLVTAHTAQVGDTGEIKIYLSVRRYTDLTSGHSH